MNEINKMKAEHARYKKALTTLTENHSVPGFVSRIASEALNLTPITLADLQAALRNAQGSYGDYVAILMNQDGSGNFRLGECERCGAHFNTLQEALDKLISGDTID